jgi:hypothetical protein
MPGHLFRPQRGAAWAGPRSGEYLRRPTRSPATLAAPSGRCLLAAGVGAPKLEGVEDAEAWARLSRVLDVCEREALALSADSDERLSSVLKTMNTLLAEIIAALATLGPDAGAQ